MSFLSGCGGGSGGSSGGNSNPPTSSVSSSSSSASSVVPIAKTISEIDVVKQTKPSTKFLQYIESLLVVTNNTIDTLKKLEVGGGDVQTDVMHLCEQNSGNYIITATQQNIGAHDFKITFDKCYFREYNAVLTGDFSVAVKTWNRTLGVDSEMQIHMNQLSYSYKNNEIATISGDFDATYSTGEDFANKTITASSNISFKNNNATDFIKSLTFSHKVNYAKGDYTIDLNSHVFDSQINSEFDLATEQSLAGKAGRAPLTGNIKQTGYSNNLKYLPVADKEKLTYQLSFDLGNQNNYQTIDANYNWTDFLNLSLFWDYSAKATWIDFSTGEGGLSVHPTGYLPTNDSFYLIGTPGSTGYVNQLKVGQQWILYTSNPVDASQNQQVIYSDSFKQNYTFDLVVKDTNKLVLIPPNNLPPEWYSGSFTVKDQTGATIQNTLQLQYISP